MLAEVAGRSSPVAGGASVPAGASVAAAPRSPLGASVARVPVGAGRGAGAVLAASRRRRRRTRRRPARSAATTATVLVIVLHSVPPLLSVVGGVACELCCRHAASHRRSRGPRVGRSVPARWLRRSMSVLGQHRRDQDRADHAGLGVAVDVGEAEAVAQVEHDEDRRAPRRTCGPSRRRC